jgi:hypothetical protein
MKQNNFHFILLLSLLIAMVAEPTSAQSLGYYKNRIAISADGNSAPDYQHKWPTGDPDDWGASAAMLAILAKLELQEQLVHFSYNNFIEAPAGPDEENQMKISIDEGIRRWDFDASGVYDITTSLENARDHLVAEMIRSTPSDPLYFIHMGLSEFFYQAVKQVVDQGYEESLNDVFIVSHSGFNDVHLRRENHYTIFEAIKYSGGRLKYHKIKDQNAKNQPDVLWSSSEDFSPWYWMRDHTDPDVRWIYERMLVNSHGVADISDAGMLFWLFTGDEDGSPEKFREFIGEGIQIPE